MYKVSVIVETQSDMQTVLDLLEAAVEENEFQQAIDVKTESISKPPVIRNEDAGQLVDTEGVNSNEEQHTEIPNCYKCKNRMPVPGDAHSSCLKPLAKVTAHQHGIDRGWFFFPINFDPAWLISCDSFELKD